MYVDVSCEKVSIVSAETTPVVSSPYQLTFSDRVSCFEISIEIEIGMDMLVFHPCFRLIQMPGMLDIVLYSSTSNSLT